MVQIVTFLDTSLPAAEYASRAKALRENGWTAVRNTAGNRRTIFYKYYEYLVQTHAASVGKSGAALTPAELEPLYRTAENDFGKYEMFIKNAPDAAPLAVPAAAPPEEVFASDVEVAAMQPMYAEMEQLMSLLGGLKMGGKKRRHTKYRKTKRRHSLRKKHRRTRRN